MSISFIPSGPSVRSDAARAAVSDTSVYTIEPRPAPMAPGTESDALNTGLLRSVPWSEGRQAGRLMRGALAERFGVPCYDVTARLAERGPQTGSAQRGLACEATGARMPAPAPIGNAVATLDVTTEAHLVSRGGAAREDVLFLTFDVLFDPAFRAIDPDALGGMTAVANYQDLVGLSVAPLNATGGSARLLPEAVAPHGANGTLHYAHAQTMEECGRIRVESAGESGLTPCAGGTLLYANRIGSSAGSDDFDLAQLLEQPGPAPDTTGTRDPDAGTAGGGVCWLSALQTVGGLGAPAPYDVARPDALASFEAGRARLRRLPAEATSGIGLSYCAAFAIDPLRPREDVKIDVMATQRMVSAEIAPDGEIRLSTTLFVASFRVVLRNGADAAPSLFLTRRRCWGTDLRSQSDPLGHMTIPRPVAGTAWHG